MCYDSIIAERKSPDGPYKTRFNLVLHVSYETSEGDICTLYKEKRFYVRAGDDTPLMNGIESGIP